MMIPLRTEEFDPNTVTPGVVGFVLTFLVALVVVFLVIDMTRRVRRVRYRGEISERLDQEETAASDGGHAEGSTGGDDRTGQLRDDRPKPLRDDLSPPER